MKRFLFIFVSILFYVSQGLSYEVIDVKDGATIRGYVRFSGTPPSDEVIKIDRDHDVCGREKMAQKYIILNGAVKNAVVWLDGIKKGKALSPRPLEISIRGCAIEPLVGVGLVGGRFVFTNEDPILHTVQLKLDLKYHKTLSQRPLEDGATIYNIALPKKGMRIEKPIKDYHSYSHERGYIRIKSNTHEWLRGFIFVFDHPYGTVTDGSGLFVIDGIPPGEYALMVWHEGFGLKKMKISLKGGETKDVEIDLNR